MLCALVSGLDAGVSYQVSLHAETSRGGCELASSLVYSREQSKNQGPASQRHHVDIMCVCVSDVCVCV